MGPGPPATYPIFNTRGPGAVDSKERLRCLQHRIEPLARPGDGGIAGTIAALDKRGIKHTGTFASKRAAGQPTFLRVAGVKIDS